MADIFHNGAWRASSSSRESAIEIARWMKRQEAAIAKILKIRDLSVFKVRLTNDDDG